MMRGDTAARIAAATLGAFGSGVAAAIGTVRAYPDPRPLNRLYAGVFAGIALWLALVFAALLAPDARSAWRRVLLAAAISLAAAAIGPARTAAG